MTSGVGEAAEYADEDGRPGLVLVAAATHGDLLRSGRYKTSIDIFFRCALYHSRECPVESGQVAPLSRRRPDELDENEHGEPRPARAQDGVDGGPGHGVGVALARDRQLGAAVEGLHEGGKDKKIRFFS